MQLHRASAAAALVQLGERHGMASRRGTSYAKAKISVMRHASHSPRTRKEKGCIYAGGRNIVIHPTNGRMVYNPLVPPVAESKSQDMTHSLAHSRIIS